MAAVLSETPIIPQVAINSNNVERRCDNEECNVGKLVSLVPKHKTAQFVVEPTIVEKPMLVNGFTTIFQVDGTAAKMSDVKESKKGEPLSTIYRIMPNTHAHIVNYVVVDSDGDSMRKINEGDPATMRKLLDSQRVSAEQMLKKLMSGHGTSVHVSNTPNIGMSSTSGNMMRRTTRTTTITTVPKGSVINIPNKSSTAWTKPTYTATATSTPPALTKTSSLASALDISVNETSTTADALKNKLSTMPKKNSTATSAANSPISSTTETTTSSPTAAKKLNVHSAFGINRQINIRPLQFNNRAKANAVTTTTTTAAAATTTTVASTATSNAPMIKTVPLSQLQKPSVLKQTTYPGATNMTKKVPPKVIAQKKTTDTSADAKQIIPPATTTAISKTDKNDK